MPQLKNNAARLIRINTKSKDGQRRTYRVYPAGAAVDVPDAVLKLPFVQAKMKEGELAIAAGGGKAPKQPKQPKQSKEPDAPKSKEPGGEGGQGGQGGNEKGGE